jgi:hypothetical protein
MRSLGRHGLRWVNVIKMDLRERECKNVKWTELRFEIYKEVKIQIMVFWTITPCSLVGIIITNVF